MPGAPQRVLFADQLRGPAALLVVVSHLAGIYWLQPEVVAHMVGGPVPAGPVPALVRGLGWLPFEPGALGVSVFFLLSGFVIPFALERQPRGAFLRARLWRIFPAYLAALLLGLLVRTLSGAGWGDPRPVEPLALLANALLLHGLLGIPSIEPVNWTLAVEMKFYLLLAFAHPLVLRWKAGFVLSLALLALAANLAAAWAMPLLAPRAAFVLREQAQDAMLLPFILLGTLFFLYLRGRLGRAALLAANAAGLALFLLTWASGPAAAGFFTTAGSYLWGWCLFALAFALRRHAKPRAPLRWLSAISYPLYLVHATLGFALLQGLVQGLGLPYPAALAMTLAVVFAVAWGVHVGVEKNSKASARAFFF